MGNEFLCMFENNNKVYGNSCFLLYMYLFFNFYGNDFYWFIIYGKFFYIVKILLYNIVII